MALVGGLATTSTALLLLLLKGFPAYGSSSYFVFMTLMRALNSWLWLIAIFSFGCRYGTSDNRFLAYANEAVLPFYVLHQNVIVTLGYYLIHWNSGVYVKYLVLCVASFSAIYIIYELLVRRINILRVLFGLKRIRD